MKKKVKVIIINDDHVPHLTELGKDMKVWDKKSFSRCLSNQDTLTLHQENAFSGDDKDPGIYFRPTALIEEDDPNVFGFKTPTKDGRMFEKAASSSRRADSAGTPRTPKHEGSPHSLRKKAAQGTARTPNSQRSKRLFPTTPKASTQKGTPKNSLKYSKTATPKHLRGRKTVLPPETPFTFKDQIKARISKIVLNDDSFSDEDLDDSEADADYSPSESDASENEEWKSLKDGNDNHTPVKKIKNPPFLANKTPCRISKRKLKSKVDVDAIESSNEYFIHNNEACVTSDFTLNHLEVPRLAPEVQKSLLQDSTVSHPTEKEELLTDHSRAFDSWLVALQEGYSIFLCGIGSKKSLLSNFQKSCLIGEDHLIINGFFPSLTLKSILLCILEDIMEVKFHPQGIDDQMKIIMDSYAEATSNPLYLVINNLDGPMLRIEKAQFMLSKLASSPNIHVIASFDHINTPLMFNASKLSCYNPLWWDATTYAPYLEETSYENSLLVQQSGVLAMSSLNHVFKSLTPNSKGLFLLLAQHQLKNKEDSSYIGLAFSDLYQQCREAFLVNSDLTLRTLLTEFRDHKLIQMKKSFDGTENLLIPLNHSTLAEFVDQHSEECL